MARREHRFCFGFTSHTKEHGFYPCGGGSIFQDDPFCSLLEDDGCHPNCSPIFLGDYSHAWGSKIYYIVLRYKIHEPFLEESVGKDRDQA